jgi:beta-lactamase superfamily II metal-dependent hydrolase
MASVVAGGGVGNASPVTACLATLPVNTRSIVLLVSFGDFECLLTGDATFPTENAIMARYPADWLDVEVLKLGHHGSRTTSTSQAWADATSPEVCIASAAYSNSYGHPADDVRSRIEKHTDPSEAHKMRWYEGQGNPRNYNAYDEAAYCTARSGTIVVKVDGAAYSVEYSD